ncbi:MAG: sulfatase [Sedimentisphaerales bacterium]|nr:sulfatase [Sedimentisphaerales bacterium]
MIKKLYTLLEKLDDYSGRLFSSPMKTPKPVDFSLPGEESERVDRVILVTLDTLRADHLSCYGYPRNTSPFLDALAANGVFFRRAYTSMSTTVPAHASILTGLHPIQHNVFKNGHRLNDKYITITQQFKKMDFQTAAFVSTDRHFKPGNMHRGFDVFDEPSSYIHVYRRAKPTVNQAVKWLRQQRPEDKFFLWLHLFDPHDPFKTPVSSCPILREETPEQRSAMLHCLLNEQHVDKGFYNDNTDKILSTMDAYDAEIMYMDWHLRRFFQAVQAAGLGPNTLWIVTADHGEGLGNHRWMGHGKHVYNEQVHIPLMVYLSSRNLRHLQVDHIVEHVDILPTIMELLHTSFDHQALPIQGESLVPLFIKNGRNYTKDFAFIQRRHFDESGRPEVINPEKDQYEDGEKYALKRGDYKYIYHTQGNDELYCDRDDYYEINNLINHSLPEEARLRDFLQNKVDSFRKTSTDEPQAVDQVTIERLKALGYYQ